MFCIASIILFIKNHYRNVVSNSEIGVKLLNQILIMRNTGISHNSERKMKKNKSLIITKIEIYRKGEKRSKYK